MFTKPAKNYGLGHITEEILNGKLHFCLVFQPQIPKHEIFFENPKVFSFYFEWT